MRKMDVSGVRKKNDLDMMLSFGKMLRRALGNYGFVSGQKWT